MPRGRAVAVTKRTVTKRTVTKRVERLRPRPGVGAQGQRCAGPLADPPPGVGQHGAGQKAISRSRRDGVRFLKTQQILLSMQQAGPNF